ncbi:MAG: hypothetical protein SGARI_005526, partial [Bacillariaceae sp.]
MNNHANASASAHSITTSWIYQQPDTVIIDGVDDCHGLGVNNKPPETKEVVVNDEMKEDVEVMLIDLSGDPNKPETILIDEEKTPQLNLESIFVQKEGPKQTDTFAIEEDDSKEWDTMGLCEDDSKEWDTMEIEQDFFD